MCGANASRFEVQMQTLRVLAAMIVLAASGPALLGSAQAGSGAMITGAWSRTDGGSRITIEQCGDLFCAVNTWIKDPSKGEEVGDRFVMTLQPSDPARLTGEALDVKRGTKYTMLILVAEDAMTTQGCVLSGVVCKTMKWVRVR
jgi:uncharacterized protein (DUF2147 family)